MTIEELGRERYLLLETRKRDGSWVGTPVNLVVEGGRGFFKSYDAAGKAKRLRNFPEVRVAPCTMRGRVTSSTYWPRPSTSFFTFGRGTDLPM